MAISTNAKSITTQLAHARKDLNDVRGLNARRCGHFHCARNVERSVTGRTWSSLNTTLVQEIQSLAAHAGGTQALNA